jgi:hypothetical protein
MMSRRLIACILAVAVSMVAQSTVAQPTSDWPSAQKELRSLSLAVQADCERAWDLVWQWAKRGEQQARLNLLGVVSMGWIRPPGLNQDTETMLQHYYTFLLHALAEDSEEVIAEVKRMPFDRKMSQASAQPYLDCAASNQRRACVDGLVAKGLIAAFDTYAREVDILAAAPGAKRAYCSPNAFHSPARKQ